LRWRTPSPSYTFCSVHDFLFFPAPPAADFPPEVANVAACALLGSGSYAAAVCWHVRYDLAQTNAVVVLHLVDFYSPTVSRGCGEQCAIDARRELGMSV